MEETFLYAVKRPKIVATPNSYNNLQYNFCKNPKCLHYGIEPSQAVPGAYSLSYGGKGYPILKCNACGETPPMKSNQGITEEIQRLSSYLQSEDVCCSTPDCPNNLIPVGTKKAYRSFGTTRNGAKRFQCCLCKKTLSFAKPTQWQRDSHHNIDIFKFLVNKVPLSRIVSLLDINWVVLYNRIDFIHQQCLKFAADREKQLKSLEIEKLYLATDRQTYEVNWTERKDKRNVVILAMATADNTSGYVFGVHPNFDYSLDRDDIEKQASQLKDFLQPEPFRRFARLWLNVDYESAMNRKHYRRKKTAETIEDKIEEKYDEVAQREDVENFDSKSGLQKLPNYGIQIKAEYTMIAHFFFLKNLIGNIKKWRFFLDQESGIRSAVLTVFKDEIKAHTAEAFYVSIEKEMTVDEKRRFKAQSKKKLGEYQLKYPQLDEQKIKLLILQDEIERVQELGSFKDKWVHHPFPSMSEPNKSMCWLTEHQEFDLIHKAWLYNKASLHSVDVFFQKIRRRISMFERPIHSAGNSGRVWNGYGAYNPAMINKLLDIFRVVHNYIDTRKEDDGSITTPAMRLGLAKAPIDFKTVLYFEEKI